MNDEKIQQLLACGTGHKRLDDNLFKRVDDLLKMYKQEGVFEIEELNLSKKTDAIQCNVNGCQASFTSMAAYNSHYNSNHRYNCIYCRKLLQSAHLLDLHLTEMHDNFFSVSSTRKPMFKCFNETCQTQFWNSEERNNHCLEIHMIPKIFLRHYGNKKNKNKNKDKIKNVESSSSTGLESMTDLSMAID